MTFTTIPTTPDRRTFGELLGYYRERLGVSRKQLGGQCAIHPSYLSRMEAGDRPAPPRAELLDRLFDELHLNDYERDRLLVAGGYAPRCVHLLGTWPRVLDEIAHRMLELSDDERDELVYILARIAIRFGAEDATREEAR